MQTLPENFVDFVIAQALEHLAGQSLRFVGIGTCTSFADGAQTGLHFGHGETNRTRMLWMQDEHFGNALRLDRRVILAVVGFVSTDRFQHRHPLMIVGRRADAQPSIKESMILNVNQACGHLGTFESPAYFKKIPSFVMRQGGVGNTVETVAAKDDFFAETVRAGSDLIARIETFEGEVKTVEIFPHFTGDAIANRARIFPRFLYALHDGARISLIESKEFEDIAGSCFLINLSKDCFFTGHGNQRVPA